MPLASFESPRIAQPVTIECMAEASRRYQMPIEVLGGVMAKEGGRLGQASRNSDGSFDLGPMQVNSYWLKVFAPYGITEQRLRYDGCANIAVGAWILRYEQGRSKGGIWTAVGRYHSHNEQLAGPYIKGVAFHASQLAQGRISINGLLAKANRGQAG